jgi:hypothetical protein
MAAGMRTLKTLKEQPNIYNDINEKTIYLKPAN